MEIDILMRMNEDKDEWWRALNRMFPCLKS